MTACPRPACAPPHQVASLDRAASGQPRHMSKIHTGSFKTVSASARRFRAPCDLKLAHMDQRRGVPQHRELLRAQRVPGWHHILPLNPSSGTSLHAVRGHARRRRCALVWRQHRLLLQVQQV